MELGGEAREFAKDLGGLNSDGEGLRELFELAGEVQVFFEGRAGVGVGKDLVRM